ncbi:uncharacterized protein LOC105690512 [Athalia rosae]|uniref:uncharacterized protein LOC105690512 n=1 Tax=Athalia rosae TaxID=37344 RepID=UPI0020348169|nr:uncharacterized protein LOC105690512 [Athalia rosae]
MSGLLATLPIHLACQLISPGYHGGINVTLVEDSHVVHEMVSLPSGYTAFPEIGVAYKYYKNKLTWNVARKQCMSEGASLAVIDSFRKIDYVASLKEKTLAVHTGIHRLYDNTAEWTDVRTGLPMFFVPWNPTVNPTLRSALSCTALWADGSGVGPWNCGTVLPVVCEIPLYGTTRSSDA